MVESDTAMSVESASERYRSGAASRMANRFIEIDGKESIPLSGSSVAVVSVGKMR